jgi:hypothetical protein
MKTLTFFTIVFIVTFVNTTKSVSYVDVAQSLAQLHQNPTDGIAQLNKVEEGFLESHKTLETVKAINLQTCENLNSFNLENTKSLQGKINNAEEMIKSLAKQIAASREEIEQNVSSQKAESAKIETVSAELKKGVEELVKKENELIETVQILYRLKNIANDELAGNTKINTEMGKYNVVSNNGVVSFIQKSNLKEELKNILKKSETTAKSLISTLIMMASNDDGHYSDPKIISKILAILDKIIDANNLKKKNLKNTFEETSKSQKEIVDNALNIILNLKEANTKNQFLIELNNKETNMYNRDIQYFKGALNRRIKNSEFQANFCKSQAEMMETHQKRYTLISQRVNELKSEFGQ